MGRQGRVTMVRVSGATEIGECWVCAHGKWYHRLLGWLLRHAYDPIQVDGFKELQRLDMKYSARAEG